MLGDCRIWNSDQEAKRLQLIFESKLLWERFFFHVDPLPACLWKKGKQGSKSSFKLAKNFACNSHWVGAYCNLRISVCGKTLMGLEPFEVNFFFEKIYLNVYSTWVSHWKSLKTCLQSSHDVKNMTEVFLICQNSFGNTSRLKFFFHFKKNLTSILESS